MTGRSKLDYLSSEELHMPTVGCEVIEIEAASELLMSDLVEYFV